MMIQINLLPWREKARIKKRNEFGYIVLAFIGMTLLAVLFTHIHYAKQLSRQRYRNTFFQTEIAKENATLMSLNDQVSSGETSDKELHFLMTMRNNSYQAVSLLDELVRVIPEAVTFSQITRAGNDIMIAGKAASDYQITELMKNMSQSHIFNQPELVNIDSKSNKNDNLIAFQLKVTQKGSDSHEKT